MLMEPATASAMPAATRRGDIQCSRIARLQANPSSRAGRASGDVMYVFEYGWFACAAVRRASRRRPTRDAGHIRAGVKSGGLRLQTFAATALRRNVERQRRAEEAALYRIATMLVRNSSCALLLDADCDRAQPERPRDRDDRLAHAPAPRRRARCARRTPRSMPMPSMGRAQALERDAAGAESIDEHLHAALAQLAQAIERASPPST